MGNTQIEDDIIRIFVIAFIILIAFLIGRLRVRFRARRRLSTALTVPSLPATMPAWAKPDSIAFVQQSIRRLRDIPWGKTPVRGKQQAQALFAEGKEITLSAQGDYQKLERAIPIFAQCPLSLALTGAALVMFRLSYVSGTSYIPEGLQEAIRYTSEALKHDPKQAEAWLARTQISSFYEGNVGLGLTKLALDEARKYAAHSPQLALVEANYYRRLNNRKERIAALYRALAASAVGQLSLSQRGGALDSLAEELMAEGKVDEALATYDQENAEFPDSHWAWHNASIAYDTAGRYAEALERSDRALSFYTFSVARVCNALLRLKLGLPVPALVAPQTDEARDEAASVYVAYAIWLQKQGDEHLQNAEKHFLLALQTQPARAETHFQHGIFYEDRMQRLDLARAEYTDAVRLDPERVNYRYRLANCLAKLGPLAANEAEQAYVTLSQINPNLYDVHREYGRFLMQQQPPRWEEAERELRAALYLRSSDEESNRLLLSILEARRQAGQSGS
jgi:tetratricopeptide (TPR) repeat protein